MFFSTLEIAEPGFLFVNLSYENESDNWVYFDDLKITHTPTNIVQYNDYYPYGLQTSTSWTREDSHNNHLYNQGNELNPSTGWYETFFRNYDPALGRFTAIDPLATKFASLSGYHYAYNNPVMFNDPLGAQGEPGNPWFSGGYRWMENMSPPPAAYNSMGASTFGSTMGNYWYQAMSGNNWGEQMMHQSQLASQARGGDMGAVREYAARYGGGLTTISPSNVEIWHSNTYAGGENYQHVEIVVNGVNAQSGGDSNPVPQRSDNAGINWLNVAASQASIYGGAAAIAANNSKPLYTGAQTWANTTNAAKSFSIRAGVVGLAFTGTDMINNGINTSNSLDATFGVIGFFGTVGAAVSGVYFVGNLITVGITGQSIGEHIDNYYWMPSPTGVGMIPIGKKPK